MNTRTHLAVISTVSFIAESALLSAQPAHAQQPGEQARSVEEIVITGSRIRQNPLEERLPVMSLGTEDYRASGATSLGEFVQKLPIAGSAINRTNNSSGNLGYPPDGGGIGAGAAEIDLRYLASKRVLVLVDGRRWIKGSSGPAYPELSTSIRFPSTRSNRSRFCRMALPPFTARTRSVAYSTSSRRLTSTR